MSLWNDKYRPKTLDEMNYHNEQSNQLKALVQSGEFPHLLFYGPPGSGKKTRILALLRELYGSGVDRTKIDHKSFKTPSGKTVEITTLSSNYHIEMNPSDAGIYDRIVVQDIIKEIAQSNPLDQHQLRQFKVVVLNEVDHLTKDAQHALRRTMEKYSSACRLILCCHAFGKVIPPVRSRCLPLRVASPSMEEITSVLFNVAEKESISLPTIFSRRVAEASEGNLRRALLLLEGAHTNSHPFTDSTSVPTMDWEKYIEFVAVKIINDQSPSNVLNVRNDLYELISHCIPSDVIFRQLTFELMKRCDDTLKYQVIHWASFYEHRSQIGSKVIFHLEAFVIKFMQVYKKFLIDLSAAADAMPIDMDDEFA